MQGISGAELAEWEAWEAINGPLGPQRADILNAIQAATVANVMGGADLTPGDFIPRWDATAPAHAGPQDEPPIHPTVKRFEDMVAGLDWIEG